MSVCYLSPNLSAIIIIINIVSPLLCLYFLVNLRDWCIILSSFVCISLSYNKNLHLIVSDLLLLQFMLQFLFMLLPFLFLLMLDHQFIFILITLLFFLVVLIQQLLELQSFVMLLYHSSICTSCHSVVACNVPIFFTTNVHCLSLSFSPPLFLLFYCLLILLPCLLYPSPSLVYLFAIFSCISFSILYCLLE